MFFGKRARQPSAAAAAAASSSKRMKENNDDNGFLTNEYKTTVRAAAYIGPRGWTVPKAALSAKDIEQIRKQLTVHKENQMVMGAASAAAAGGNNDADVVYAYRESVNKMYIPRFWAAKRYGGVPTVTTTVARGDTRVELEFCGELRPAQKKIVQTYLDHVSTSTSKNNVGGLLSVPCAAGKTVMAINIICQLRERALIIVHKEFLLNQWIERIGEFARRGSSSASAPPSIGRIQGDVFDVEGRDFVVAMLQTLYARTFPDGAFASFGITVVDETHRICSDQFSNALFKINTKYSLGISATIHRKDGMHCLLEMFLGDVLYHEERSGGDDAVQVRAIEFRVPASETEYHEVPTDARGNVMYSTMVTKLSDYEPRNDFLVRVLRDLRAEDASRQIMVLSFTKRVLRYLHDACERESIGTVGYYVGGMKQKDLTATESKDIVLATYSMAAEALDIKTLQVLVMATPKTDIVQSVGRILRVKHANPVVVDIIDTHGVFRKQWQKRQQYYRSCNYSILMTNSNKYKDMLSARGGGDKDDTIWRRKNASAAASAAENDHGKEGGGAGGGGGTCLISI